MKQVCNREELRSCFSLSGNVLQLALKVQPRCSRSGPLGTQQASLRWGVQSAPVDGAANEELLLEVAKFFGVSKSAVELRSGAHSRRKLLTLGGLDVESAVGKVADSLGLDISV